MDVLTLKSFVYLMRDVAMMVWLLMIVGLVAWFLYTELSRLLR